MEVLAPSIARWPPTSCLDERRAHVHLARGQPFLPFGQHGDGSNDLNFPFGGYKLSGNGRDKSLHALDKYTELKSGCAARCRRAARSERAVQAIAARSEQARLRRVQRVVPMPSACRGPCVVTNVKVDRGAAGTRLLAVVVRRDGPNARPCALHGHSFLSRKSCSIAGVPVGMLRSPPHARFSVCCGPAGMRRWGRFA